MPIVDVEQVGDREPGSDAARRLADGLGEVFGSPAGSTWVRLRPLPRTQYAENGVDDAPEPVFVQVLMSRQPVGDVTAELSRAVAGCVADVLEVERTFVHVLFAPSGAGRIAFGGELRE